MKREDSEPDYNEFLGLVKSALYDARLLDHFIIEERKEGYMLKHKIENKNDKIKAFESLAGSAVDAGESVKDLIKMANREEDWRNEDIE